MKTLCVALAGMAIRLVLWAGAVLAVPHPAPAAAQPSRAASSPALAASAPKAMLSANSDASGAVSVSYLQGKLNVAPDAIETLGPQLFGDRVNLYNGAFSFAQTDLSLPGNNELPVAIERTWSSRSWIAVRGAMADWDLNTPRIEGAFSNQWGFVSEHGGGPAERCGKFSAPPSAWAYPGAVTFPNHEYWQGTQLVIPGEGSQELLVRNLDFATLPPEVKIVTRNLWKVGCLDSLLNGAGQGFFAISPKGVTYTFNWLATRAQSAMRKGDAVLQRADWMLMATEVSDRFGNQVRYTYSPENPLLLTKIESSDGRVITVGYSGSLVTSITDGSRTWQYVYGADGGLWRVVRPDGSEWKFELRPIVYEDAWSDSAFADCDTPVDRPIDSGVGKMWHPSGAYGEFHSGFAIHGRSGVTRICYYGSSTQTIGAVYPRATTNQVLYLKKISGPGLPALSWQYRVGTAHDGYWAPCTTCPDRKVTTVIHPDGNITNHYFGIRWRVNEGQLLRLEEGWNGNSFLRATDFSYRGSSGQAYPENFGYSPNFMSDMVSYRNLPQERKAVWQQGATFTWQVDAAASGFDVFARPRGVVMTSSLGHTRSEWTELHDHYGKWVLGQKKHTWDRVAQRVSEAFEYHPVHAMPTHQYAFDRLVERYEYYADGTLYALYNAGGRPIWLGDYKRGQPQYATLADGAQEKQLINNQGTPDWRENAALTRHYYAFDAMGRVRQVDYPAGDASAYHPTIVYFDPAGGPSWGMPAGHWRQHLVTGNKNVYRIFDALWRERVKFTWDGTDWSNTVSIVETRYDHEGRKTFVGYPTRNFTGIDQNIPGVRYSYDALGRVEREIADSEQGPLTTRTEYLPLVFQKRVSNPRGFATTFAFQAFDTPVEDSITQIWAPEGVSIGIVRDVFGRPTSITRGGPFGGGTQSSTRRYVYDFYQRLCKTIEPESGATVQAYDASSNIAWRASGLNLPDAGNCNDDAVPAARKVSFGYDLRERLTSTTYGDGSQNISRDYTADSLLSRIGTSGGGRSPITWYYGYNKRRLLVSEHYNWSDPPHEGVRFNWPIDSHGNVAGLSDAWGWMGYSPNALGQPREVSGYAGGVTYHPNGMVAGYTLANGVVHSVTQNTRGLPELWRHAGVSQDRYTYDANGNVTRIFDEQQGLHRSMPLYDALDRLRQANGPWGSGVFGYDALDNLVSSQVGGRSLTHRFDGSNRLVELSGSLNMGIGYDDNGNIINRGGQVSYFDIGNRLMSVPGKASYVYDGHGRRNLIWYEGGVYAHQAYTSDGKLRMGWKLGEGGKRHVYLGDKLIAETAESGVTTFSHTDALGSPVARSDSAGAVTSRTRYEPYGATVAGSDNPRGIGFTGHVNDPDTGLVYMQQRYYDPIAGRFLSVDPVTTNAKTGDFFGRYHYANNNPYRFKDSDGRAPDLIPTDGSSGLPVSPIVTLQILAIQNGASPAAATGLAAAAAGLFARGSGAVKAAGTAATKAAPHFDTARRAAFEKAGMTDPSKVQFSKMDPKTGTVVEFKAEGGAKVGYDGPHKSPGPHHDSQHISWQSEGKRDSGGTQRGNEPYSGPQHPSRLDRKDQ